MKFGTIVFYKNIKGFTSWLQRVVTGYPYSHSSIYVGQDAFDYMMEFEANPLKVERTRLRIKKPEQMEIYEFTCDEAILKEICGGLIEEFEGEKYGYVQWLTTFIRICLERLGFKKAKNYNILWGWGKSCSEVVYHLLERAFLRDVAQPETAPAFEEIGKYNPDLFHNGDIKDIIDLFPTLFRRLQ